MHLKVLGAAVLGAGTLMPMPMAGSFVLAAGGDPGQVPRPTTPPTSATLEDQIARAIAASRPGPEHQPLEPLVGTWNTDVTWYAPPLAPLHLTGTTENRWILGGRFLLSEVSAGEGASRIESVTVYGHDAEARRYFALGLNDLATGYKELSGTYGPRDRPFILSGKERDEATGKTLVSRQQIKIESPDRYSLHVFRDVPGRPPVRVAEATFTRR